MREHADFYKQFIDVHPGGGVRRNPKRKNAGAYSTSTNYTSPTPAEINRVFESHLQQMARGGTYGDNMEIVAFSQAYRVNVMIYQRDFAYLASEGDENGERSVVHIAYHVGSLLLGLGFATSERKLMLILDLGTLLFDTKHQWSPRRSSKCQAIVRVPRI